MGGAAGGREGGGEGGKHKIIICGFPPRDVRDLAIILQVNNYVMFGSLPSSTVLSVLLMLCS